MDTNIKALTTAITNGAANIAIELEDASALARAAIAELTRMGYVVASKTKVVED